MEVSELTIYPSVIKQIIRNEIGSCGFIPEVKKIITDNPPYTTILFKDGTKQVVKFCEEENLNKEYDRDKGVMIALLERIYGKKEFYSIMGWGKEHNKMLDERGVK